jgi:hypothetical protein
MTDFLTIFQCLSQTVFDHCLDDGETGHDRAVSPHVAAPLTAANANGVAPTQLLDNIAIYSRNTMFSVLRTSISGAKWTL